MTSTRNFSIRLIVLFFLAVLSIPLSAQANHWFQKIIDEYDPQNEIVVTIEKTVGNNSDHPYIDEILSKNDQFVKWLYFINVHHSEEPQSKKKIAVLAETVLDKENIDSSVDWLQNVADRKEHKLPLTFTVVKDGQLRYATLNNIVVINKKGKKDKDNDGYDYNSWDIFGIRKGIARMRTKSALKDRNLQGDLPKGAMTFINASRNRLKCGVNVPTSSAQVKIVVNDLKGNLIATLVDDNLRKGWNNYKWNRGSNRRGKYQLAITVDDQTLTQNFKVK